MRWLEFLSYIHMLVYHERERTEHRGLQEAIEASVQADPYRQEIQTMGQTIAEALQEKGRRKGGNVYLLSDSDGDGLEDRVELFWDNRGRLRSPIGMALTPPGYAHGQGLFVAGNAHVLALMRVQ